MEAPIWIHIDVDEKSLLRWKIVEVWEDKFYNTLCQVSEDDELDWSILKDLLVLIVSEDCSLGIAFILTEFSQREPVVAQEILEDPKMAPYVLYLASLQALVKRLGPKTFHVPPGLLYACAKSLNTKNCLNSELFESALTIAEVEFE